MRVRTIVATFVVAALLLAGLMAPSAAAARPGDGGAVERAVEAMGGDALTGATSLRLTASGTRWTLDEGPYPGSGASAPGPYTMTISLDLAGDRQRLDTEMTSYFAFDRVLAEVVGPDGGFVDGQDQNFAPPFVAAMLSDRWASTRLHQALMNPHLLLLYALANPESVSGHHSTLVFDTGAAPLYLRFNPRTGLPVKAWTLESDPLRRDVPMAVHYDQWTDVDGLLIPLEVSVSYDGEVVQHEVRSGAELNVALDPALFELPDGVEPVFDEGLAHRGILRHQFIQSFAALGFPRDGLQPNVIGTEIAPGVHFLTGGSHNSIAVVQSGGVTLVEAPLDEVRSAAIAEWIDTNLGLPIVNVVASHHHADHAAGVRQFVNHGVRAVVHEDARRFFASIFRAPSRLYPDRPAHAPRHPRIAVVPAGGSYVLEDPVTPIAVHTLESEHASDLVMVEVSGVLFVVDIYNPGLPVTPDADPIAPRVAELGLDIDLIAGGHGGTIAWDDFIALLG